MKRLKRFANWRTMLLCLLIGCCATGLRLANAQGDRQPAEKMPGVPEGYTIIDGDIQMPISVVNAMRSQAQLSPNAPEATLDTKLWPNGIIPFRFEAKCEKTSNCTGAQPSGCVSVANQQAAIAAMAVLEAAANVDFRQCPGNNCNGHHIRVRDSSNDTKEVADKACESTAKNNSPVGRQGGEQTINIVSWTGAASQFIIVHELLHSLGFFHEQSRGDRDSYVEILTGNIKSDSRHNYQVENAATAYGYYDFDSLMHYWQCEFSANPNCPMPFQIPGLPISFPDGGITVKVKPPYNAQLSPDGVLWQQAIGQRRRLSFLDQLSVSFLYPQPNWRFADLNYKGKNGTSDGSFLRPYASLNIAINATPTGGVLWVQPGQYFVNAPISKQITLRAPLGGVQINHLPLVISGGPGPVASLSAASYNGELASESIAAAFGQNLASGTAVASSLPLPTTLAGTTVKIKDSEGAERDAPLFFVSPTQINYQVPAGTSVGIADVTVYRGGNLVAKGTIPITDKAPGLFTADASGQGAPAGIVLRVRGDAQIIEPLARYDPQQQRFVPVPIDLGPESDQVFLILFGSGFRAPSSPDAIGVSIGGENAEVLFAGPAPGFIGLDQANVRLPRSLAGKGEVSILLTADNRSANTVTVRVR